MREILKWVEKLKDEEVDETQFIIEDFAIRWDKANEAMYSVLVDETEGEARERVISVEDRHGLEAYRRLHR